MEDKIQILQNQLNSLQEKVMNLEIQLKNSKYPLRSQNKAPEDTKIIQMGFRLNQEGKISLKKYYESTDPYSLFQLKGYNIKYESIRRNKLKIHKTNQIKVAVQVLLFRKLINQVRIQLIT